MGTNMLTRDQIQQNIQALEQQGASKSDIQSWLNSLPPATQQAQTMSTAATTPQTQPSQPGVLGTIGNVAKGIGGFVSNIATGAAKDVGSTAFNLGSSALQGIGNVVNAVKPGAIDMSLTKVPSPIQSQLQPQGLAQKIGAVGADIGMLAAPTGLVGAAKEAIPAIKTAESLPWIIKAGAGLAQTILNALPEAGVGFGFGLAKGETPKQAVGTAATFGALSGLGEIIGNSWNAIKGGLVDNITKAIGVKGSMSADQAIQRVPQITRAFKTISNLAPQITVKDSAGVDKPFVPTKATFPELLQAWTKSRDLIYNAYTDLAKQAGDKGAQFTTEDFSNVVKNIQSSVKDSTSAFKSKAQSLVNDLESNFGKTTKEGTMFLDTPLSRIQSFIENVNIDVNPISDKAAAQVSATASKSLRDVMDKKIMESTGGQYQKLRNSYADLKSIEKDLVNQTKRAVNQTGGNLSKYIEGYGSIDTIVGLLTKSPTETAKGLGIKGYFEVQRLLKDPEIAMRRAFQQLGEATAKSPLATRVFGK